MQVLVSLKFDDGDFTKGFPRIALSANIAENQNFRDIEIKRPPAPQIPNSYQNWQKVYIKFFEARGIKVLTPRTDGTVKLWNWNFDDLLTRGCNNLEGDFKGAVEKFTQAQQQDNNIDLHPEIEELDNNPEAVARELIKQYS